MRAVRDSRWKLIVYPKFNHQQLFDLKKDPGELRDLTAEKPAEVERLIRSLYDWQQGTSDKQPLTRRTPFKPGRSRPSASTTSSASPINGSHHGSLRSISDTAPTSWRKVNSMALSARALLQE